MLIANQITNHFDVFGPFAGIVIAALGRMKQIFRLSPPAFAGLIIVLLTAFPSEANAQEKVVEKIAAAEQPVITPAEKQTIKRFNDRVKDYVNLRGAAKAKAPKLSKDSSAEQIQAAENAFGSALRAARAGAKAGDLFAPEIAQYIRTTLKTEVRPSEKKEIREVVLEKETNIPVTLKVNYPYPDPKEFVEMPATLLLKLPQLPKELKYRYVGRNLLLVDSDNNLIVDYMLNALP
jgi:ABC-type transporter MlaC component